MKEVDFNIEPESSEVLIPTSYKLPKTLKQKLEALARIKRRSANAQLIIELEQSKEIKKISSDP